MIFEADQIGHRIENSEISELIEFYSILHFISLFQSFENSYFYLQV